MTKDTVTLNYVYRITISYQQLATSFGPKDHQQALHKGVKEQLFLFLRYCIKPGGDVLSRNM
jgi:hypothetical protein